MQQPHSPSIGNRAGAGCGELSPTCYGPSRTWAGVRDSAPSGPRILGAPTRAGGAACLSCLARERGGRNGGSAEGPGSASYSMAGGYALSSGAPSCVTPGLL